ncbi:sugar transferase [Planktomarina sp.]|nr:sugar transferase [Planktomarina sp.]
MKFWQILIKRAFDFLLAGVGLVFTSPIIITAWIVASIETRSNGFFFQSRVGQNKKLFILVKIKTMRPTLGINANVTQSGDVRITKSGAFFRNTKIDELPQLWNVLVGQMSFVGPRPDVEGYADKLLGTDSLILSVRPGITGPASLKYKNEEALLMKKANPEKYNNEVIWPDKVKINIQYVSNWSFSKDIGYIFQTITGA